MVENNQGTSVQQHGTGKLRTSDRSTPRFTIRVRIVSFLVLVAVLAGGVVGFVTINTSLGSLRQSVLHQNLDQAELAAQFASNYMKVIQANARAFTARPTIIQAVLDNELERAQPELASFVKIQTVLNGAGIYDINGIQKAYSVADAVTVGQSFTDCDWFQQAVATSEPYQGIPVKSKGTGVPVSTYAIPILDGQGQIRAVLSCGISLGRLSDAIVNIDYGADTRTSMIDFRNGGFILADRDPQLLITPVSGKNEAVSRLLAGEHGAIEITSGSEELDLVGFAPVPDLTWGVMVITPSKTALAVAHILTQKASLITGLIILFAAILGGVFVLQITRPLLRLVEGTIEVGRGNLDYKVTTARRDEIGALSRAFGDMTEKLKNTLASRDNLNSVLKTLRGVNQLIVHQKDRERLIQRSCDLMVETRGSLSAWILLFDENRNPVSVASAGLGEEVSIFMEQLNTSNYTECLKELLSQEKQLLVYDRPGIRHKNCVLTGTHSTRGVFICKLEYEGKLYGVLGVAISSTAVSDEEEQGLFLELAGDISFALANIESEEERKRAEEATKASEIRYRRLFEAARDGILILNAETGQVADVNPFLLEMLGFAHQELLDRKIWELGFLKDIIANKDTFVELQRKGYVRYEGLPLETAAGQRLEVEFVSNLYEVEHQKVIQCNIRDITERKRAEEAQEKLSRQLQAKVSELEAFSYGIAHDLRSPLVSIEGFSRLLREDMQNQKAENVQEDIHLLESSVRKMQDFLNKTLAYSRAEHLIKRTSNVSFGKIANEVMAGFNEQMNSIGATFSLVDKFPRIYADKIRIGEVMTNLIQNSIKYRDKTVPLKIEIGHYLSKNEVVFFVRDNGLGIDASEAEKVFSLFYRGTASGEGSGIGLTIVKKIIEAHGGRIWVQQGQSGKGTTMCFTLPRQRGIDKGDNNEKNSDTSSR